MKIDKYNKLLLNLVKGQIKFYSSNQAFNLIAKVKQTLLILMGKKLQVKEKLPLTINKTIWKICDWTSLTIINNLKCFYFVFLVSIGLLFDS